VGATAGRKAFGLTPEFAQATRTLAANQGLYNGFLAAGLFWGLSLGAAGTGVKVFFLACVLVAGVYGAATASRKILFIQGLPAPRLCCWRWPEPGEGGAPGSGCGCQRNHRTAHRAG